MVSRWETCLNLLFSSTPGGTHSISKLPYVRPKIWLSKLNPYSAVQNGEFHTLRVHFNNEKQPLQCTNNFFLLGQLQEDKKKF